MIEWDVYKLLADGGHVALECKKAQNDVPNSLQGTYSAFANMNGGTLLLGVHENIAEEDFLMRFTTTDAEDADRIRKDLWNTTDSCEEVNVNLLYDEDVQIISVNGKEVIAINVLRIDYNLYPVYISNNLMRGTYRRNHEGDYYCTEQMMKMMVCDAYEDDNNRMSLGYYVMGDIDIPTSEGYRVMFKTNNPEHIQNNLDHKEFLMQLGSYVVNRKDGTEGLIIAGLLMFGKGLPVRERFDYLHADYIDKSNLVGDQRYNDQLAYNGTQGE